LKEEGKGITHVYAANVNPTVDEIIPDLDFLLSPLWIEDRARKMSPFLPRDSGDRLVVKQLVGWRENEKRRCGYRSNDPDLMNE
jgi:hypothetical protein